ncbi:MAG: 1-acylglycerol-3-phosphate O-acyltransferase [Chitinivibrionales bacterium]|nr:1-acylglycerol-3-phosphate O-acyltransferase [Chitinivibrionales bacterium]
MAEQNSGVKALRFIHSILFIIWAVFSVFTYSIATFIFSGIYLPAARGIARAWCKHLLAFSGAKITIEGIEKLDSNKHYVFVSNHQSHLDIPSLMGYLPCNLVFVAKKELFRIPFFGWGLASLRHISIDRSSARKARESFTRAVALLKKENLDLVIFPEGTRSVDGTIGPFKRGAFALPLEAGLPIVPVTIAGTRNILPKKSYLIHPGNVTVTLHDPVKIEGTSSADKEKAAKKVREIIIGDQ